MNNNIVLLISLLAAGYFIGSVPFALVVSKLKGIDLRKIGSGNIGATNVYRAMGMKYAALVFFLDGLKGLLPTLIAIQLFPEPLYHILVGSITIIGHSLSVFVKFKGGKGAATGLGVLLALNPLVFAICATLAGVIIYSLRIVSVATITNAALAPLLLFAFHAPREYILFVSIICFFIILRHKANIVRLIQGKENKV